MEMGRILRNEDSESRVMARHIGDVVWSRGPCSIYTVGAWVGSVVRGDWKEKTGQNALRTLRGGSEESHLRLSVFETGFASSKPSPSGRSNAGLHCHWLGATLREKENVSPFHAPETKGWPSPMKPMPMFPIAPPARDDVDQAPIAQQVEAAPGEIALDAVIRAQSSSPQVVRRLTTLEDCLWAAVDALSKLPAKAREVLGADDIIERAKILLRGDLELPEHDERIVSELPPERSSEQPSESPSQPDKASTLPPLN